MYFVSRRTTTKGGKSICIIIIHIDFLFLASSSLPLLVTRNSNRANKNIYPIKIMATKIESDRSIQGRIITKEHRVVIAIDNRLLHRQKCPNIENKDSDLAVKMYTLVQALC